MRADGQAGSAADRGDDLALQLDFRDGFDLFLSQMNTGQIADQTPVLVEPCH